jgi:hypothetical protein
MNSNLQLNYCGFEDYYVTHNPNLGGVQYIFHFENNYGASVIKLPDCLTGSLESKLWELAVIIFGEDLYGGYTIAWDTPIADDVIQNLTDEEVRELLGRIKELPADTVHSH